MRKLKNLFLLSVLSLFSIFISCDENDDNIRNREALNRALSDKYPEVIITEWDKEGAFYVADCNIKGIEAEVWYTTNLEWVKSEFELTYDMLPSHILDALTTLGYGRVDIDDIELIYELGKDEYYEVEIDRPGKDLKIFIDRDGEVIG